MSSTGRSSVNGTAQLRRDAAPAAERPGVDRLIARIERERVAARIAMESYLRDLLASGVPSEAVRRFGPAAAAPESEATDGPDVDDTNGRGMHRARIRHSPNGQGPASKS